MGLAAALGLAAAVATAGAPPALAQAGGALPTAASSPAAQAGAARPTAPVLGVNADLARHDPVGLAAIVDRLARAGVRAVRQPVRWADFEPAPGALVWEPLDRVVEALDAAGIAVLLTLETSPAWARRDPPPPPHWFLCADAAAIDPADAALAPPTDPADLARFAGAVAGRYRGRVWAYEVWREPNILPRWRRTGPDPEAYGRLLAAAAAAVRGVDPTALVVSAGLAPTTDVGVCYMSDAVFLARLARGGFLDAVDAVGIEPFGLREGPQPVSPTRDTLGFARAELLHATLARWHVDRPLWAVAWGWHAAAASPPSSTSPPPAPAESPWGTHPPAVAARWLGEGWSRARAGWPWMGPMFVWHLQPHAPPDDPVWGFALLDPSGAPTALWDAVAAIAAGDAPPGPPAVSGSTAERLRRAWPWLALAALIAAAAAAVAPMRRRAALGRSLCRVLAPPARLPARTAAVLAGALGVANVATGPLAASGLAPPWLVAAVSVTTLAALAWLLAGQPRVALGAVAAALPFNYGLALRLAGRPISPVELLVALAVAGRAAAWCAASANRPPRLPDEAAVGPAPTLRRAADPLGRSLDALAAGLAVWATLSIAWSEHRAPALYQWRTVIVEPLVYYALLRTAADRRAAAQAAADGLVLGGAVAAVWGLAGVAAALAGVSVAGLSGVSAEGVVRALGPYGSPNNLALFLGRVAAVIAAYVVFGGTGMDGVRGPNNTRRRAYALAGIPIAAALVATFSRGLIVAGVPALALTFVAVSGRRARRALAGAVATLAVVAVLLAPFAGTPRVRDTFRLEPGTTLYIRVRLWQSAVEMARDHPWLGVGLDNFLYHYRDVYVRRDVIQDGSLNHPHNWLLDWWTRLGLPGLVVWLALALGNARAGRRAVRAWDRRTTVARARADGSPQTPASAAADAAAGSPLAVAALGMQVYAVAHGLVDNSFFLVDLAAVWWIGQAALLAAADDGADDAAYGQPHL